MQGFSQFNVELAIYPKNNFFPEYSKYNLYMNLQNTFRKIIYDRENIMMIDIKQFICLNQKKNFRNEGLNKFLISCHY